MSYDTLSDVRKTWILTKSGKELYLDVQTKWEELKLTTEEIKQIYAFWLNEHDYLGPWSEYEMR